MFHMFMVEYPVMSTSQGTYGQIEEKSEVMRDTYKMYRAVVREDWNWEQLLVNWQMTDLSQILLMSNITKSCICLIMLLFAGKL